MESFADYFGTKDPYSLNRVNYLLNRQGLNEDFTCESRREKMISKKLVRMIKSKKIEVVHEVPLHIDLPPLTSATCKYDFISSLVTGEGKLLTADPHSIWIVRWCDG